MIGKAMDIFSFKPSSKSWKSLTASDISPAPFREGKKVYKRTPAVVVVSVENHPIMR